GREGEGEDTAESGAAFVLFAVDDMFFYRDFELPGAVSLLARDPAIFCVHLRLNPGITWSHTSGGPCKVPPLAPTGREVIPTERPTDYGGGGSARTGSIGIQSGGCRGQGNEAGGSNSRKTNDECRVAREGNWAVSGGDGLRRPATPTVVVAEFGLLSFARREGTGEWDYPWDLTGGLYRRQDAVAVLSGIVSAFGKRGAGNPNLLEYHGDALLWRRDLPRASAQSSADSEVDTPFSVESATASPAGALAPAAAAAAAAAAAVSKAVEAAIAAPRCGSSGKAVVSSIAVNRVQSTYSTPVYASREGGVQDLDRRLWTSSTSRQAIVGAAGRRTDAARAAAPAVAQAAPAAPAAGQGQGPGERRCDGAIGVWGGGESETRTPVAGRGARERGSGSGGLDGAAYRRRVFNSVHVGELWFDEEDGGEVHASELAEDSATSRSGHGICRSGKGGADGDNGSGSSNNGSETNAAALTVLLPVKDGGDLLLDAVESVIACALEMPPEWSVELLIVDDGSEDGAVGRAVAAIAAGDDGADAAAVAALGFEGESGAGFRGHARGGEGSGGDGGATNERCAGKVEHESPKVERVGARVEDDGNRGGGCGGGDSNASGSGASDASGLADRGTRTPCGVTVRVLRHDRSLGLADSLNEGLREAKSDLVARMDADDVCMPGRLRRQMSFMLENPHVAVLGTSVATFSGPSKGEQRQGQQQRQQQQGQRVEREAGATLRLPASRVQRIARHPTDPELLAWSMLFGCCVAHPSVMLRRDRIVQAGGYDPETEPAEDYDLWLRVEALEPGSLANLGEPVSANAAAAVRRPESAASAGDLVEAARLLGNLGEASAAMSRRADEEGVRTDYLQSKVHNLFRLAEVQHVGRGWRDQLIGRDERRRRGHEMVARDLEARLGAMAVLAMSRFGSGAAPVLEEYRRRFPDRPLLLALGGGGGP
ncbi:unnamed protein product, partial [Hapterophycus canaliculatus]